MKLDGRQSRFSCDSGQIHRDESLIQTERLTNEVRDARVDILQVVSTSHELERMRRTHRTLRAEVAASASESVRRAFQPAGISGRSAASNLGENSGNLALKNLCELLQQGSISFDPGQHGRQIKSGLDIHFRMNGDWEIGATSEPLDRFARAAIELTDGTRISLVDRRALSSITLDKKGTSSLPRLGREASDASLDADYLSEALRRKKIAIKPALMDQSVIAGLGNIYAAEALWEAELDPRKPAAKLSRPKLNKLVDAIRLVLSPKKRLPGRYTDIRGAGRFAVYDREGKNCGRCDGIIKRIVQAGRSTYFCPGCQRG